jgi:tRNA uridine 5-carbamoylmethylation protein Kti12
MQSPEIILLAGAPGSGKSTIGKHLEAASTPADVRHLAIGDLKRDITSGNSLQLMPVCYNKQHILTVKPVPLQVKQ